MTAERQPFSAASDAVFGRPSANLPATHTRTPWTRTVKPAAVRTSRVLVRTRPELVSWPSTLDPPLYTNLSLPDPSRPSGPRPRRCQKWLPGQAIPLRSGSLRGASCSNSTSAIPLTKLPRSVCSGKSPSTLDIPDRELEGLDLIWAYSSCVRPSSTRSWPVARGGPGALPPPRARAPIKKASTTVDPTLI